MVQKMMNDKRKIVKEAKKKRQRNFVVVGPPIKRKD